MDIEDALRSSKTTLCLRRELKAAVRAPGIHILLSRWTDDATHGIFKRIWREMCRAAGVALNWYGEEHYDELANGARATFAGSRPLIRQINMGGVHSSVVAPYRLWSRHGLESGVTPSEAGPTRRVPEGGLGFVRLGEGSRRGTGR